MTAKKPLRAVQPGEKAAPATKKTVKEAAEAGSHLELLVAMRDRIATAVADPKCPPRDLAALTRRLADIAEQIKDIQEAEGDRDGDEAPEDHFDASAI